ADSIPIFLASDNPPFFLWKVLIFSYLFSNSSHNLPLPSVLPSLTKIISIFLYVWFTKLLTHLSSKFSTLYTGTIILNNILNFSLIYFVKSIWHHSMRIFYKHSVR